MINYDELDGKNHYASISYHSEDDTFNFGDEVRAVFSYGESFLRKTGGVLLGHFISCDNCILLIKPSCGIPIFRSSVDFIEIRKMYEAM